MFPSFFLLQQMIRKAKTTKYAGQRLPHLPSGLSSRLIPLDPQSKRLRDKIAADIIQQIINQAEMIIDMQLEAQRTYREICWMFLKEIENILEMENFNFDERNRIQPESEPPRSAYHIPQKERILRISRNGQQIKEKSQSCDSLEINKLKYRIRRERQQSTKCFNNQLVSLQENTYQHEDDNQSQEIKNLIRRKKDLRLQTKPSLKENSIELPKPCITERKERKLYYQSDEGKAEEIKQHKEKISKKLSVGEICTIKCFNYQHFNTIVSMKRKPIVQFTASRRKKRAQNGDTCVFIEQLNDFEGISLEKTIQTAVSLNQGAKISSIDSNEPIIIKLPPLR